MRTAPPASRAAARRPLLGRPIHLFRLFGFAIRLDPSWFVLAVLVAWTLATQIFPYELPLRAPATYWVMGAAGAVALFLSIIAHEFSHAVVARRHAIHIRGITLFIFGGIAEMESEPPTARSEFLMALAGPVASVAVGLAGFAALRLDVWSLPSAAVVRYVATINVVLAVFNCVPAFPLDGGRMLRAALWHRRRDLRSATRTATRLGAGFGWLLFAIAGLAAVTGDVLGGLWLVLIGLFVRRAARASYQQVLLRSSLEGQPVRRFVQPASVIVPPGISVQALVDDYVFRHHHRLYPVGEHGRLAGCVSVERVRQMPRDTWRDHSVAEVTDPCSPGTSIRSDDDAFEALTRMRRARAGRLLVVDDGVLAGILTMHDLQEYLALRNELPA